MPKISDIHIDTFLTNISIKLKNEELVASQVFPEVKVTKDTGKVPQYDTSHMRPENDEWADKAIENEVDWGMGTQLSYATARYGLSLPISPKERRQQDPPINVDIDATETLTGKLQVGRERRLATILQTASNYHASSRPTIAGGKKWDDYSSAESDPIADFTAARKQVHSLIFTDPNVCVMPKRVYESLKIHPKVKEQFKYTSSRSITKEMMQGLFEIPKIVIAGAGYESAAEGATSSLAYIWGNYVMLGFVNPRPTLRAPSWGYHLMNQKFQVEKWREKRRRVDMVRVSMEEQAKLLMTNAGYLIQAPLSA